MSQVDRSAAWWVIGTRPSAKLWRWTAPRTSTSSTSLRSRMATDASAVCSAEKGRAGHGVSQDREAVATDLTQTTRSWSDPFVRNHCMTRIVRYALLPALLGCAAHAQIGGRCNLAPGMDYLMVSTWAMDGGVQSRTYVAGPDWFPGGGELALRIADHARCKRARRGCGCRTRPRRTVK